MGVLSPDDEIVVYCSDAPCIASQTAYTMLKANGFTNVRLFAGGLREWEEAGYPLDREAV